MQQNLLIIISTQPIPLHSAEKASFREMRFIIKVLDTTPKIPISIALILPKKAEHSIPIYTLEVKSALNPASRK